MVLVVPELALVDVSFFSRKLALPVLLTVDPLTDVLFAIGERHFALTVPLTILESAFVYVTGCVAHEALSVLLVIEPLSIVRGLEILALLRLTLSISLPVLEITVVDNLAISCFDYALAMELAI